MNDLLQKIISFLLYPSFDGWLFSLRIVFLAASLLLLVVIVFLFFKASWIRYLIWYDANEFIKYRPHGVIKVEKTWRKTKARADTGLESEYKLAVMEADSILDDMLKRMGYHGETLGERLNALTPVTLSGIDQVKEAHQIRNNIIHDPDYRLSLDQTKKVLDAYEQALKDLEAF